MAGATRGVERCQPDLVGSVIYMPRDLPIELSTPSESAVTSPKRMSPAPNPRHLSVISSEKPLTRGQVANRLGLSISTVRRFEGSRLHPTIDSDDVRWYRSDRGDLFAANLKSVIHPCRKQHRHVLTYLNSAIHAALRGRKTPSLIAAA